MSILDKVSKKFLVPSVTDTLQFCNYKHLSKIFGSEFVVQFGKGWAGKTTFFVRNFQTLDSLKSRFPQTKVKVSKMIKGFTVLNNCCIYKKELYKSNPAIQINGIKKIHPENQVTCGRQWSDEYIDSNIKKTTDDITVKVSKVMIDYGYRGYFGLDFLIEKKTNKVFLSEINARLTASSSFYTKLELGKSKIPLMMLHFAEFTGMDIEPDKDADPVCDVVGSQLILRSNNQNFKILRKSFGTYKVISPNNIRRTNLSYDLENLKDDEFIFIPCYNSENTTRQELGRIETKMKILQSLKVPADWTDSII